MWPDSKLWLQAQLSTLSSARYQDLSHRFFHDEFIECVLQCEILWTECRRELLKEFREERLDLLPHGGVVSAENDRIQPVHCGESLAKNQSQPIPEYIPCEAMARSIAFSGFRQSYYCPGQPGQAALS